MTGCWNCHCTAIENDECLYCHEKQKKKKELKTIQMLNFGCYPGRLMFCHGFKYDEIIKELQKQNCSEWLKAIHSPQEKEFFDQSTFTASKRIVTDDTGHKTMFFFIIFQKQFDFSDEHFCILAHEVLHICQMYLPDILNRDLEIEAEAYLHTHLMSQCLEVIRGTKK